MQRTDRVKSSISFVRTLHTHTYRSCKWEDMGMHCLATVICQICGEIQEKYSECGSILTILRGVHVTASSPNGFKV